MVSRGKGVEREWGTRREEPWKGLDKVRERVRVIYRVRPGLCNTRIIKVFRVHESSSFVNVIDNSSNANVIEDVID